MPIFYAMLPMLILAISLCILDLVNTHKVWIFILPVIVCALFLYHPDIASAYGFSTLFSKNAVMALQIILVALWLMILLGGNRIAGLANKTLSFPIPVQILLAVFSLALSVWLCFIQDGIGAQEKNILIALLLTAVLAFIIYIGLALVFHCIICPICVLERQDCRNALVDYGPGYERSLGSVKRFRGYYCFICFENDPEEYAVSRFVLQKVKGKVDSVYTYRKCRCLFGVTYIDRLKLVTEHQKKLSSWGELVETPKYKKTVRLGIVSVAIIGVVLIVLFTFIFTHAG